MLAVAAPLLHNNVPVKPVAVRSELPSQLFTTVTEGVPGVAFIVTVPEPEPVHPLTPSVTVTEYGVVEPGDTVIEGVVAPPGLHK